MEDPGMGGKGRMESTQLLAWEGSMGDNDFGERDMQDTDPWHEEGIGSP